MEKIKVKNIDEIKSLIKAIKPELVKKYHLKSIGIFGSYVRNEQKEDSDIDVLIELSEPMGLITFIGIEREISELIGIKVDLIIKDSLKPRIGQYILKEVLMI